MQPPPRIIHLVFKTHLDVGFTDFAAVVVRQYFEHFIPAAIKLAANLRTRSGPERFVWTTGAWLIYEYLEQAHPANRLKMEQAILAGDIAWHALPFTTHTELMDAGLFRFGLSLSQTLDRRFGKTTIAAKMTDVPGHTRGCIPLLADAGVKFLHIGVNPASHPPAVPGLFNWRHPDGSELLVGYQKGAYGDFMTAPGLDEALYIAHTSDNLGPPTPDDITRLYAHLQARFPQAEICAGRLDDFAAALEGIRTGLPVVTAEIGDTWIHGVGSDPQKVARFRELLRLRRGWFAAGRLDPGSSLAENFQRALLLVPEHTWGLDEKTHLADRQNFSAEDFRRVKDTPPYQRFAASWTEQRAYLDHALAALQGSPLHDEAIAALDSLKPALPNLDAWQPLDFRTHRFTNPFFELAFDEQGALCALQQHTPHRDWVAPGLSLGQISYQTFSQADYDRYYAAYVVNKSAVETWAIPDQTKPGMATSGAESRRWNCQVRRAYHRLSPPSSATPDGSAHYLFELICDLRASVDYGCPRTFWLEWVFPKHAPEIRLNLSWFEKPAARLPEALWLTFAPARGTGACWNMDKLGSLVDPRNVVAHGNRRLHAVGSGIVYANSTSRVEILTLDAPLVAPGSPSLLDYHNRRPSRHAHPSFLLYNNIWGTNFPMWSQEDALFRFILRFS